jgi:hypothetical protein
MEITTYGFYVGILHKRLNQRDSEFLYVKIGTILWGSIGETFGKKALA